MEDDKLGHLSNLARFSHSRFREANRLFKSEDSEESQKAEDICRELLLDPQLPLYLRARCHAMLAVCNGKYLYHAQQALHYFQEIAASEPEKKVWADFVEATKEILKYAEIDWAEEYGTGPDAPTEEESQPRETKSLGASTKGP